MIEKILHDHYNFIKHFENLMRAEYKKIRMKGFYL